MTSSIFEKTRNEMEERNIATTDEIDLVCTINGWTIEILNDIIYARTGYIDLAQFVDYEGDVMLG